MHDSEKTAPRMAKGGCIVKVGYCFMSDWLVTRPELVQLVDDLGYDGIEIWAQAFDAVGLSGVQRIVGPLRCEVASVNPYFDFTTSQESFEESLRIAERYVEYARALSCSRVRTWASRRGAFASGAEATPEEWERAVRGIQAVCDLAAPYDIACVLEVHHGDGQIFDTSENTLRILELVDRPNCTVNLQPPLLGEDPLESARRLGPYVTHLHAHNWRGRWGKFTRLGEGDIDFEAFVSILRGHGFDGYISLEHTSRDPEGLARDELLYLRDLIARLERGLASDK